MINKLLNKISKFFKTLNKSIANLFKKKFDVEIK